MISPTYIAAISWFAGLVAGQCHWEGDKEYCLKDAATTTGPECHLVGNQILCYGSTGPTSTLGTVSGMSAAVTSTVTVRETTILPIPVVPSSQSQIQKHPELAEMTGTQNETKASPVKEHSSEEQKEEKGHGHGGAKSEKAMECFIHGKKTYNLTLRVVAIFVILTTSTIGILTPIVLRESNKIKMDGLAITFFKQFGTGVIISTVFIHLLMHAAIQFDNPCLGELQYEATVMALAMAGAFIAFLVDYTGVQYLRKKQRYDMDRFGNQNARVAGMRIRHIHLDKFETSTVQVEDVTAETDRMMRLEAMRKSSNDEEKLGVVIMEGGIIFHSILVGVLLTVTPDKEFPTLFAVVLIHQMFEGIALGSRIAPLEDITHLRKIVMSLAFSCTAPLGMAIGLSARKSFNGNSRGTILLLGTMDALSAGVLAWVAFVELWSKDWLHGELRNAERKRQVVGMGSLVAGIVIMSVLGKWA